MRPPSSEPDMSQDLFRHRLDNVIDMRHELVILSQKIDWASLEEVFGKSFA